MIETSEKSLIPFFVMGYCPTNDYIRYIYTEQHDKAQLNKYNAFGCTEKDCVFVGCVNKSIPRLIIVDNRLYESFGPNITQFVELLLFETNNKKNYCRFLFLFLQNACKF